MLQAYFYHIFPSLQFKSKFLKKKNNPPLFKLATMGSPVAYPDKHYTKSSEVKLPRSSEPPDCQCGGGSRLPGECWSCGSGVKAHFKIEFQCVPAAEAVLTLLVKFPCTRPSTKSCALKALTKDERDSMERPFISVWYLSIMDHLPCSKIRRRTSLQCTKENKTTGFQELFNVRDPISGSGLFWRREDGPREPGCGLILPPPQHPLLATGRFRTAATWLSSLTQRFDTLVAELLELSKPQATPGTSPHRHREPFRSSSAQPQRLRCSHFSPSPRTHLARVSGLMRMLKYVFFSCSVIISKTAGVKLKSDK